MQKSDESMKVLIMGLLLDPIPNFLNQCNENPLADSMGNYERDLGS